MTAPVLPEGIRLHAYRSLASTNAEARRLAAVGERGPLVVWTRVQPSGRGRRGRVWSGPEGNLMMSLLVRPGRPPAETGALALVAALAVADCVEAWGEPAAIKWPNDVLVDGAKVAGILLEGGLGGGCLAVGIGVNLAVAPELGRPVARVRTPVSAGDALSALAAALWRRYRIWCREGFGGQREEWLGRAAFRGETVRVRHGTEEIRGRFADIDGTGSLVVVGEDGTERRLSAGEMFPTAA